MTLIQMFNRCILYARHVDGEYLPCDEKRHATHELVCTKWNVRQRKAANPKLLIRSDKTRPRGIALSVMAVPLKRKQHRTSVRLRKPLEKTYVYDKHGSLFGKRAVLAAMYPSKRRHIAALPNAKCDALYLAIIRAHKHALKHGHLSRHQ